jgi:hypothetical protein
MPSLPPSANLQVIRCWLMARERWPLGGDADEEGLKEVLRRESVRIEAISPSELIAAAEAEANNDPERSKRLLTWSWQHASISLADVGPWRSVGDALPQCACRSSAVEATQFLVQTPDTLPDPETAEQQARYRQHSTRIRELARFCEVWRSIPLLSILVAEREQRGREGCAVLKFSTEDGSHRAIALALAHHCTVPAWVGNPPG